VVPVFRCPAKGSRSVSSINRLIRLSVFCRRTASAGSRPNRVV
jgi:hypothetical protein